MSLNPRARSRTRHTRRQIHAEALTTFGTIAAGRVAALGPRIVSLPTAEAWRRGEPVSITVMGGAFGASLRHRPDHPAPGRDQLAAIRRSGAISGPPPRIAPPAACAGAVVAPPRTA